VRDRPVPPGTRQARAGRLRGALAALASLPLVAGCGYAEFLWQGAVGQAELIAGARPLDDVLATTPDAKLAERLARAREIRAFASRELTLPDNASYLRYADLGRPFVVWNVFAAPPLSLEPRQWCFPVAGCVNYRGYFREEDAKAEAARVAALGDDVHVGGVPAYSTLGWFDDPLLSTFIRYPDTALARLVFHELAHQVVYVKDDTSFNEAFATVVEEEGLARWLAAQAGTPRHEALVAEAARGKRLREGFRQWMREARAELEAVYASAASDAEKRARKAAVFERMRAAYEAAKAGESGLAAYDRWFAGHDGQGPNNASIAAVALYDDKVPAFRALLAQEGGDLPAFYGRVRALAAKPKAERDAALAVLGREAATAASASGR
jgi:predicted aminopeptidase